MQFVKETVIHATPERVFAFHELPDAFARLMPPWENTRIISPAPNLFVGARTEVETRILGLFTSRWVSVHTEYDPPRMFEDTQVSGPFRRWRHRHIVKPRGEEAILRDEIEYEPPLGFLGRIAAPLIIVPRLERLFAYRHEVTRDWSEGSSQNPESSSQ